SVMSIGVLTFMNGSLDFWTSTGRPQMTKAAERWILMPPSLTGLPDLDLSVILQRWLERVFESPDTAATRNIKSLGGRNVVPLLLSGGGELDIAASGRPVPIRFIGADGEVTFDGLGATFSDVV